MDAYIIIGVIVLGSFCLGCIKYKSIGDIEIIKQDGSRHVFKPSELSWQWKFVEIWNATANFIFAGLIGYYFVLVRWPVLLAGGILNVSDLFLIAIFALAIFGHLCVLSLNVTKGVEAILKRVFDR